MVHVARPAFACLKLKEFCKQEAVRSKAQTRGSKLRKQNHHVDRISLRKQKLQQHKCGISTPRKQYHVT